MLLKEKEEIKAWLNQYQIINYEIIKDEDYGYVVNVNGSVNLARKKLKSIDVKFNQINGWFSCAFNHLTSLEGCPEIVNGSFYCNANKINSFKYSPKVIGDHFFGANNLFSIDSLNFFPSQIKNNVFIMNNKNLGELQNKENFQIFKEIIKTQKEKEKLLNNINKETLKNNNIINNI